MSTPWRPPAQDPGAAWPAVGHADGQTPAGTARRPRCTADPHDIRDWLTSTVRDPDQHGLTVAEDIGIDELFGVDDVDVNLYLTRLVEGAQSDGVFGVPGHGIQLWHVADEQGNLDGHLIVVRLPDGRRLASDHIPVDHLVDPESTGLDAAASVLTNTAVTVDELLTQHAAVTPPQVARPAHAPATQAFPALALPALSPASDPIPGPPGAPGPAPTSAQRRR